MKARRARYGSGSLMLRGRIWHARFWEIDRLPDSTTRHVQHWESTGTDDRNEAQKFLNRKLREVGGSKARITDPKQLTYEDLRDDFLRELKETGSRSLR